MSFIPQFEWFFHRSICKKQPKKRKKEREGFDLSCLQGGGGFQGAKIERVQNKSERKKEIFVGEEEKKEPIRRMGWLLNIPKQKKIQQTCARSRLLQFCDTGVVHRIIARQLTTIERPACRLDALSTSTVNRGCGDEILSTDTRMHVYLFLQVRALQSFRFG